MVALTAFQTLKSMVKRVANGKWEKKGKTKTKVTPRSGEEIDEHIEVHAEKIKEGKGGEIYGMVIHLLQPGLTVYSVVSYWYHYMPNLEGKDMRTHLCRATRVHDAIVQTSININVACMMPLIQLLHGRCIKISRC